MSRNKLPDSVIKAIQEQHPDIKLGGKTGGRYGVPKARVGNLVFDSDLERYQYEVFTRLKVPFKFKPVFVLQEDSETISGKKIRGYRFTIDFKVRDAEGKDWYVDTKGVVTPDYVLRWKRFVTTVSDRFIHIKTRKEADSLALLIHLKEPIESYAEKRFKPTSHRVRRRVSRRRD